jgi:hypothetical protein
LKSTVFERYRPAGGREREVTIHAGRAAVDFLIAALAL